MESRTGLEAVPRGVLLVAMACTWLVGRPALAQLQHGSAPEPEAPIEEAWVPDDEPLADLDASAVSTLLYVHGNSHVYTVELASHAVAGLGSSGVTLTDVALAPDGTLYGITFDSLFKVNTQTGAVTRIPTYFPVGLNALVWAPEGMLLAAGAQSLFRINPATGATTLIGPFGIPYQSAGDLEFGLDGTLYLTAFGPVGTTALLRINPSTGAARVVGDIGFPAVYGLVRAHDGRLLGGTETGTLLEIDPTTGQGTALFSTRRALWGMSGQPWSTSSDTTPPVITTPGDITLECAGPVTPLPVPVSAVDDQDGPVPVTCQPGGASYPLGTTYTMCSASDAAGNVATAGFSVTVLRAAAPTLTLVGDSVMELECGVDTYVDPGATAVDTCRGPLEVHKYNSGEDAYGPGPNTAAEGTYSVQYIAWDETGYTVSALRSVRVMDRRPPTLQLWGPAHMTHACGSSWVDPGVVAADACYGNVAPTVRTHGFVNGWSEGTYTLRYEVTDSAGNSAPPVTRTVQVVDCPW